METACVVLCHCRAGLGKRSPWPVRAEEGHNPFFVLERSSVPSGRETAGGGHRESQQGDRTGVSLEIGGRGEADHYGGGRMQ